MSGAKIIDSLNEAVNWTAGEGVAVVTLPGEPPREMTIDEYHAAVAANQRRTDEICRDADERRKRLRAALRGPRTQKTRLGKPGGLG